MNSTISLAAFAAMTVFSATAFAHAGLDKTEAQSGQVYKAAMRISHGCNGNATREVRVKLPEGFFAAKPMAKPGWTVEVIKDRFARSYEYQGQNIDAGAVEIRWSGGELADDMFDEFVVRGVVAAVPDDTVLYFPTTQLCDGAELAWVETGTGGHHGPALKYPAPSLKVFAQAATTADTHAGHAAMGAAMAGDIAAEAAWTRATPPNAKVAGGFLVLANKGAADDRLLGGSSPIAERVEVHEMTMDGDVMKMRPLSDGLVVPAGDSVELKPGGYHIMLMGLKQPLKEGESVAVTLTFQNAGDLPVELKVEAMGAKGMHGHGAGMKTN